MRVLTATGTEAEADLPFAALLTLLRPVLDRLSELARDPGAGRWRARWPWGRRHRPIGLVVHAAVIGLLSAAAADRPVLVVVDDAHWLDDASADALLFVARRLAGEPIALVVALRPVEGRNLDLAGVEQFTVEGLDRDDAAELLRRAAGGAVAADVVARLHGATAGNPLALLEAPANLLSVQLSGRDPLPDPLSVGPGVQAAFRRRLERLPHPTRTALLLVAAAGAEPLDRIARAAADLGVTLADLEPAEADHLVEVAPAAVRFRHPLVRAAAYQDAPAPDRRAAHRCARRAYVRRAPREPSVGRGRRLGPGRGRRVGGGRRRSPQPHRLCGSGAGDGAGRAIVGTGRRARRAVVRRRPGPAGRRRRDARRGAGPLRAARGATRPRSPRS